jgi:hypothetical protein
MGQALFNLLFGCRHRRTTLPITPSGRRDRQTAGTYVVCLDCGRQFGYDMTEMRRKGPLPVGATESAKRAV